MRIKITRSSAFVLILGIFALVYSVIFPNIYISTLTALAIWLVSVIYGTKKIRKRFSLLNFNIGFFTFMLGGYAIELLTNHNTDYLRESRVAVTTEAINHVGICMVICMFFVNVTYMLLDTSQSEHEATEDQSKYFHPNKNLKAILIVLFVIGYVCKLLLAIEDLIVVKATSFRIHASTASSFPYIVTSLSSLFFVSLYAYWAMIPNKRTTMVTFVMLAVPEIILMLSGERGEPISVILTILFYIMYRNNLGNYDFTIKKRTIIISLILLPFLIYLLQFISYDRNHLVYNKSILDGIRDFFATQGGSVKIVSNSYVMHDSIEEAAGHMFVSGEIRSYLSNNIFTRLLTGRSVTARTVQDAFSGDNFLRTYGYLYSPVTYNAGVGGGSTYIAEVYHDGGYIFLALFNMIIALVLNKLDSTKIGSVLSFTICISIFRFMALLPREQALQWLTGTFAIPNLLFYFMLYAVHIRPTKRTQSI